MKTHKNSMMRSIGVTSSEKAELASYTLKDVAQTLYLHWRDNWPLKGGPVTWEIFKAAFLYPFFPKDVREEKVTVFINLHQGGRSIHEYPLKFVKLFKYAPSLDSDPRDEMNHFVTGVS